jgi:hypothetical protein
MIVWVNNVKMKDWRRFTFITTTILRWYFQEKTFQNDDKTEKTRKKDLIYAFKVKITSLFILFYELRYLLINDIIQSIFKWQQSVIKQKVLTTTTECRIRYSIFITRHFTQTKNLSNNKLMFRIRCSIISISIIKYHFFRRLLYIIIKNKELRLKIVRYKICNQEEICSQEEICNQEEICSQEEICNQESTS